MDGTLKIVLALKLKFLLIILSIGTSYFLENSYKKKMNPGPSIEIINQDARMKGSGHIDIRSLFQVTGANHGSQVESEDPIPAEPVKFVTDRPFYSQDLEIYIAI